MAALHSNASVPTNQIVGNQGSQLKSSFYGSLRQRFLWKFHKKEDFFYAVYRIDAYTKSVNFTSN